MDWLIVYRRGWFIVTLRLEPLITSRRRFSSLREGTDTTDASVTGGRWEYLSTRCWLVSQECMCLSKLNVCGISLLNEINVRVYVYR